MTPWGFVWEVITNLAPGMIISVITGIVAVLLAVWFMWKFNKKTIKNYMKEIVEESTSKKFKELDELKKKQESDFKENQKRLTDLETEMKMISSSYTTFQDTVMPKLNKIETRIDDLFKTLVNVDKL